MAIKPLDEDIKRAACAAAASLPWGLIKAEVGRVGGGGHPAGVKARLRVRCARQETRRDL